MRISSRGTVSMGPVGWLLVGPIILAAFVGYWTFMLLVVLPVRLVRLMARRSR